MGKNKTNEGKNEGAVRPKHLPIMPIDAFWKSPSEWAIWDYYSKILGNAGWKERMYNFSRKKQELKQRNRK